VPGGLGRAKLLILQPFAPPAVIGGRKPFPQERNARSVAEGPVRALAHIPPGRASACPPPARAGRPFKRGVVRLDTKNGGYNPVPAEQIPRERQPTLSDQPRTVCRIAFELDGEERSLLVADEAAVIGRAPDCDLVLAHESVSRNHARISNTRGDWVVSDLGSKNGIKVNTHPTSEQVLRDQDQIDLGAVRLRVRIGPEAPTSRARVVFEQEKERGRRTEIIDMNRLGSLLASNHEAAATLPPKPRLSPPPPNSPDATQLFEPGGLLGLFSKAAEALISCDSLDETLERILALVFDNIAAERGVICLYDEASDKTEPKVMRTREGVPDEPIHISTHIANDVIKRKQSLLVQDTGMDERFGGAESVIMMKIHSAMCAPLYRAGRVVGVIYVDQQKSRHPFTGAHLHALSTLALLSAVAVEQAALRDTLRQEREIRARLARYSSPAVVNRIIREPGVAARGMVAEEGDVTVLFSDLTGFTALAESLPPAEVVQLLNQVLERLTEVVFDLEGTLDKFQGDGMMAFFGAPLPMPDHAERAVEAALRMQELISELTTSALAGHPIALRIGINSGPVVVGDIGSPMRKDYSVIGDVVNTASRLENFVAQPGQVVMGETTYERVCHRFRCEPLELQILKGKSHAVRPYVLRERIETPTRFE